MNPQEVVQAVGRFALGLDSADRMSRVLQDHLFSTVIPAVNEGGAPQVVSRTLLRLYSDLEEGRDARVAARAAFDEIRLDPDGKVLCPIETVIAGLEDAAEERQFTYDGARRLASLPWSLLGTGFPNDVAMAADGFRVEIEGILHEVQEGFVDAATPYPDLSRKASILASELRMCVTSI